MQWFLLRHSQPLLTIMFTFTVAIITTFLTASLAETTNNSVPVPHLPVNLAMDIQIPAQPANGKTWKEVNRDHYKYADPSLWTDLSCL